MAQATEEVRALAEATFGALNARDQASFVALMAEDVHFTSMVAEAEAATFRGQDGIRQWWANFRTEREAREAAGLQE